MLPVPASLKVFTDLSLLGTDVKGIADGYQYMLVFFPSSRSKNFLDKFYPPPSFILLNFTPQYKKVKLISFFFCPSQNLFFFIFKISSKEFRLFSTM